MANLKPRYAVVAPTAHHFYVWALATLARVDRINTTEAESQTALFVFVPADLSARRPVKGIGFDGVLYIANETPRLFYF